MCALLDEMVVCVKDNNCCDGDDMKTLLAKYRVDFDCPNMLVCENKD